MKKDHYQKELVIKNPQQLRGEFNNKKEVSKIQAWLTLFSMVHPGSGTATGIDGSFGPATEGAVMNFQKHHNLKPTGVVDQALFDLLVKPLKTAFETEVEGCDLREVVVNTALHHVLQHPLELVIKGENNSGPWVRSYMDGYDGEAWLWCAGFAQTILDQAASQMGMDFRKLMPLTYSCDTIGMKGLEIGSLHRYTQIRKNPELVKPGDFFLMQKTTFDWYHTGIITAIYGDIFETVEGNTNEGGSSNGYAVLRRIRNFRTSKLDVFSIEPLVYG